MTQVTHIRNRRKDPDEVYIGRPSKWGNPERFPESVGPVNAQIREMTIEKYRVYLRGRPDLIADARRELRGKTLVCYCAPLECHGHVLARVAEGGEP